MLKELHETVPKEWLWVVEEVKQLMDDLAPEGSRRLLELYKQLPPRQSASDQPRTSTEQLRWLLIRLSEHWAHYRIFEWQTDVPWTNNGSEQIIGRMKIRSRTVRGYKSKQGMLNALMLSGSGMS